MTTHPQLSEPSSDLQHDGSTDERLVRTLADIQAVADLEAAKAAADVLDAGGLQALRAWIDSRLSGESKQPAITNDFELSGREAETLRRIARGYSNKELAAHFQLSVKTVETYKARAMKKLKLRNRVQIVRYAIGRGWMGAT